MSSRTTFSFITLGIATLAIAISCGDDPSYTPTQKGADSLPVVPTPSPSPTPSPTPTATPTPTTATSPTPTPVDKMTCTEAFMMHFADPIKDEGCFGCHDGDIANPPLSDTDDDMNHDAILDSFKGNRFQDNPDLFEAWFKEDGDHPGGEQEDLGNMDRIMEYKDSCEGE